MDSYQDMRTWDCCWIKEEERHPFNKATTERWVKNKHWWMEGSFQTSFMTFQLDISCPLFFYNQHCINFSVFHPWWLFMSSPLNVAVSLHFNNLFASLTPLPFSCIHPWPFEPVFHPNICCCCCCVPLLPCRNIITSSFLMQCCWLGGNRRRKISVGAPSNVDTI